MMTVAELIEKLKTCPQDAIVVHRDECWNIPVSSVAVGSHNSKTLVFHNRNFRGRDWAKAVSLDN